MNPLSAIRFRKIASSSVWKFTGGQQEELRKARWITLLWEETGERLKKQNGLQTRQGQYVNRRRSLAVQALDSDLPVNWTDKVGCRTKGL